MKKDIRNLEKESERLNDNYEQIENIARLDIKDDASMTSLKKFSTIIYKELTSRNSALLNELNTIIDSNAVQLSYKNKLNDLKNNLTESFSQMTTKYNTFMSTPGEYNYNMFNKSIEDYKKILSDNTSSEEDVASAKEALIEIQDKLVERYGDEAKGIDLVNGKIDDQIEKIKELKREDAQKWLNENQKAIDKAQNKKNSKVDKDGLYYSGELMTNWGSGSWKKTDFMADWGKKQGYDVRAENGLGNGILYSDMGDEETLEYLNKLSEYLQKNKRHRQQCFISI